MSQQRAPPVMPASLGTTTTSSPILASWVAVIRNEAGMTGGARCWDMARP